jgi:hypothetical protein
MMPARYTGKPFWEVFLNNNPPLWQAKLALASRFRFDLILDEPWGTSLDPSCAERRVVSQDQEQWVVEEITRTRKGNLTTCTVYYRNKSPWQAKPLITDPEKELDSLLATLTDPWRGDLTEAQAIRKALGENGIMACDRPVPPAWWLYSRRRLDKSVLDFYDHPSLVEKAMNAYGEWALEWLKATSERFHPDLVMFGGSVASMSVLSPTLYRRYALPWLQKATALARRYGVFTGVHMCGRSRAALPLLAESGIDLLEPLEAIPGGDVVLAEVKKQYGPCFCLKGNVNTFQTLARGTPAEVEAEARKVIEDAGEGGGLILSTGDQTPVDTPEVNFVALINAATRYGVYA